MEDYLKHKTCESYISLVLPFKWAMLWQVNWFLFVFNFLPIVSKFDTWRLLPGQLAFNCARARVCVCVCVCVWNWYHKARSNMLKQTTVAWNVCIPSKTEVSTRIPHSTVHIKTAKELAWNQTSVSLCLKAALNTQTWHQKQANRNRKGELNTQTWHCISWKTFLWRNMLTTQFFHWPTTDSVA